MALPLNVDLPNAPQNPSGNKGFDWRNPNFLGGVGSVIGGIFGMNQGNPADAGLPYLQQANDYLSQIPGQTGQYLNPFIQQGQNAYGTLNNQFGQMINDPGSILSRIGAGYKQSPGYQFQVDQATGAANRAAAAGGMLGSPAEQAELAKQVSGFANQDFNQYLQNALGLYGGGLTGLGNFQNQGFNASNNMANYIANALAGQSKNNMGMIDAMTKGSAQQQQDQSGGLGNLLGGLGSIISLF